MIRGRSFNVHLDGVFYDRGFLILHHFFRCKRVYLEIICLSHWPQEEHKEEPAVFGKITSRSQVLGPTHTHSFDDSSSFDWRQGQCKALCWALVIINPQTKLTSACATRQTRLWVIDWFHWCRSGSSDQRGDPVWFNPLQISAFLVDSVV